MNHFFVVLLSLAGVISIREEKDKKRRNQFVWLFTFLIGIALTYTFGEFVGQMIYKIENL